MYIYSFSYGSTRRINAHIFIITTIIIIIIIIMVLHSKKNGQTITPFLLRLIYFLNQICYIREKSVFVGLIMDITAAACQYFF